tara:strand:+ start:213 stop:959 length:747 start_codon:yes stop_codon:yes gene_type:complete
MVNFNDSMNISKEYRERDPSNKWGKLKELYEKVGTFKEEKIPKKIHQIWLGSKIPNNLEKLSSQWKKLCEENNWEYYLWDDNTIKNLKIDNKFFNKSKNYGQKSDILRYEILKKEGGVYVDIDFIPIKIFDSFLLKLNFFVGTAFGKTPVLFNGLIGSVPEGELITNLYNIEKIEHKNPETVMSTTGPYYITKKFFECEDNRIAAFPFTYFYPYSNRKFDRVKGTNYKNYIKKETYCVHLWNCGWMKF